MKLITVTSPATDAGKTFIACNLAAAAAGQGVATALLDFDLAVGDMVRALGLEEEARRPHPTVASWKDYRDPAAAVLKGPGGVAVFPRPENPFEAFDPASALDLFRALAGSFDLAVADAGADVGAVHWPVLVRAADEILLVADCDEKAVFRVKQFLAKHGPLVAGKCRLVVNQREEKSRYRPRDVARVLGGEFAFLGTAAVPFSREAAKGRALAAAGPKDPAGKAVRALAAELAAAVQQSERAAVAPETRTTGKTPSVFERLFRRDPRAAERKERREAKRGQQPQATVLDSSPADSATPEEAAPPANAGPASINEGIHLPAGAGTAGEAAAVPAPVARVPFSDGRTFKILMLGRPVMNASPYIAARGWRVVLDPADGPDVVLADDRGARYAPPSVPLVVVTDSPAAVWLTRQSRPDAAFAPTVDEALNFLESFARTKGWGGFPAPAASVPPAPAVPEAAAGRDGGETDAPRGRQKTAMPEENPAEKSGPDGPPGDTGNLGGAPLPTPGRETETPEARAGVFPEEGRPAGRVPAAGGEDGKAGKRPSLLRGFLFKTGERTPRPSGESAAPGPGPGARPGRETGGAADAGAARPAAPPDLSGGGEKRAAGETAVPPAPRAAVPVLAVPRHGALFVVCPSRPALAGEAAVGILRQITGRKALVCGAPNSQAALVLGIPMERLVLADWRVPGSEAPVEHAGTLVWAVDPYKFLRASDVSVQRLVDEVSPRFELTVVDCDGDLSLCSSLAAAQKAIVMLAGGPDDAAALFWLDRTGGRNVAAVEVGGGVEFEVEAGEKDFNLMLSIKRKTA